MQNTEIGHFALEVNGEYFSLIPKLNNMAKLASAEDLMLYFRCMHSASTLQRTLIDMSHDVFMACCDKPQQIKKYLVETRNGKPHFISRHAVSISDQIQVAAALLRHGIAGVNRPRNALTGKGKPMDRFDVYRFIADAKQHFGVTLTEAQNMTMTEFYYHLAAAFPPTGAEPDINAHKEAMETDKELYEKAMAAFKGNK